MSDPSLTLATLFTSNAKQFVQEIGLIKATLHELAAATNVAGQKAGKSFKTAASDIDSYTQSINRARGAATQNTEDIKKADKTLYSHGNTLARIESAWDRIKLAMRATAAYGVAATAIYGMVNAAKSGVDEIVKFDQAIQNLDAIIGNVTDSQLTVLGDKLVEVARDTKFSTSEIAGGMQLLAQAGLSAEESLSAIPSVANLATGTLSSLETTSDLMTSSLRAFNLEASESGRIADVMASSINNSKLTVDKLRTSFNYVGASAAQMGLSIEETAATMQVLANSGLSASTIGTGFRQVLSKLIAPSRALREEFENHNIALNQVNPSIVGYETAMENLTKVLWDNEKGTVNMAKAYDLFKLRGAQTAAVIVNGFVSGQFKEAIANVYEVGTAAEMSAKQQEGLGVKFKNLKDRAGLLAVAFGEAGLTGALHSFVDVLRNAMQALEEFVKSGVGSAIIQTVALTGALLALTTGVSALYAVVAEAAVAIGTTLAGTFTYLSGVVGVAGAAVGTFLAVIGTGGLIAIVAAVSVGLYRLATASDRAAEAASKAAVLHKQNADALGNTLKVLSEAEEGSERYRSIINRMSVEYPEITKRIQDMTGAVDIASLSYDDFSDALAKVKAEETLASLKSLTTAVNELDAVIKNSQDDWWIPDFIEEKYLIERTEKLNDNIKTLSISLAEAALAAGDLTIENVVKDIQELESMDKDTLSKIYTTANTALSEMVEQQKQVKLNFDQFVADTASSASQIEDSYNGLYQSLSLLEQARLTEVMASLDKEIAEYKRKADQVGHTSEQRYAVEELLRAKALTDFVLSTTKETDTAKSASEKKLSFYKNFLESETSELNKQIAIREAQYAQDIQNVQKGSEEALSIKEKFESDISSLIEKRTLITRSVNAEILSEEKTFNAEVLKEKIKAEQIAADGRKSVFEQSLQDLYKKQEEGVISYSNAEKEKYEISLSYYQESLAAANDHYSEVASLSKLGSDEEIAAADAVAKAKSSLADFEIAELKRVYDEKSKARQADISASEAEYKTAIQLIDLETAKTEAVAEGAAKKASITDAYYQDEIKKATEFYLSISKEYPEDIEKQKAALDQLNSIRSSYTDFQISEINRVTVAEEAASKTRISIATADLGMSKAIIDQKIQIINDGVVKGNLSVSEGNRQRLDLEKEYLADVVALKKQELSEIEKFNREDVAAVTRAKAEILNAENDLAAKKTAIREAEIQATEEYEQQMVEERKKAQDQIIQTFKDTGEMIVSITQKTNEMVSESWRSNSEFIKNLREKDVKERKESLDKELQETELQLAKGVISLKEANDAKSKETQSYYTKSKVMANVYYYALRLLTFKDTEALKEARAEREKIYSESVDFEISEANRLFNEKQALRTKEISASRTAYERQLQDLKEIKSKGMITESEYNNQVSEETANFYADELDKAVAYYNKIKAEQPGRVEAIQAAMDRIKEIVSLTTDFEIAERERAKTESKKLMDSELALAKANAEAKKVIIKESSTAGITELYNAAQKRNQIEIEFLKKTYDARKKDLDQAINDYGIGTAEYNQALSDRMDAWTAVMSKMKESDLLTQTYNDQIAMIQSVTAATDAMYQDLTSLEKVHMVDIASSIKSEIDAYKKKAKDIGQTEAEQKATVRAIRDSMLADYLTSLRKEEDSSEDSVQRKINILESYQTAANESYLDRLDLAYYTYLAEVSAAADSKEALTAAEKKYADTVASISDERKAYNDGINDLILQSEIDLNDARLSSGSDLAVEEKKLLDERIANVELAVAQGKKSEEEGDKEIISLKKEKLQQEIDLIKQRISTEESFAKETKDKRKAILDALYEALKSKEIDLTGVLASEATKRIAISEKEAEGRKKAIQEAIEAEIAAVKLAAAKREITEKEASEKIRKIKKSVLEKQLAEAKKALAEETKAADEAAGLRTEAEKHAQDGIIKIIKDANGVIRKEIKRSGDDIITTYYDRNGLIRKVENERVGIDAKTTREKTELEKKFAEEIKDIENDLKQLTIETEEAKSEAAEEYYDRRVAAAEEAAEAEKKAAEEAAEAEKKAAADRKKSLDGFVGALLDSANEMNKIQHAAKEGTITFEKLSDTAKILKDHIDQAFGSFANSATNQANREALEKLNHELGGMAVLAEKAGISYSEMQGMTKASLIEAANAAIERENELREESIQKIKEKRDALRAESEAIQENINEIIDSFSDWKNGVSDLDAAMADFDTTINNSNATIDEMSSAGQDALNALISKYKELQSSVEEADAKIKEVHIQTAETIRSLQRDLMTDEQAWQDERLEGEEKLAEAVRLINEGKVDDANALFDESRNLFEGLASEIKNADGEIVQSKEKSTQITIELLKKVEAAQTEGLEKYKEQVKEQQEALTEMIESVMTKLEETLNAILKKLNNEAKVDAEVNVEAKGVEDVRRKLDDLTNPEIKIITIKQVIENSDGGFRQFASGGLLGGRPHSSGGTIIEAEKDEYIEPVSTVRKYGTKIFEMFRQKVVPVQTVEAITSGRQRFDIGGLVSNTFKAPVIPRFSFESGGSVSATASAQNLGSLNLSFNDQPVGQIFGEVDVLEQLSKHVRKQSRLRRNN